MPVPWASGWVPRGADPAQRVGVALLITAGIFPVAWAIARGSTLYDNGRHFLFVLPPLLCLAALAWTWALGALRARWPRLRIGVAVLLVGGLVSSTARTASLHPYEYTFLNVFAGGIPEAGKRFDTDYWCTSYREASLLLLRHAVAVARNGGVPLARAGFVVAVVGVPEGVQDELPEGFTVVEWQDGMRPDYLVATTRWQGDTLLPEWPVVAEVGRAGMRFAVVRTSPELVRIAPPLGGQGGGT